MVVYPEALGAGLGACSWVCGGLGIGRALVMASGIQKSGGSQLGEKQLGELQPGVLPDALLLLPPGPLLVKSRLKSFQPKLYSHSPVIMCFTQSKLASASPRSIFSDSETNELSLIRALMF